MHINAVKGQVCQIDCQCIQSVNEIRIKTDEKRSEEMYAARHSVTNKQHNSAGFRLLLRL